MFRQALTDEQAIAQYADADARDRLSALTARLTGLRDQLQAARARHAAAQEAHVAALMAAFDTSGTHAAAVAAQVDVDALEQAVGRTEQEAQQASDDLLRQARASAIAAADAELARIRAKAGEVQQEIRRRSVHLSEAFDALDDLRQQEIVAAQTRARADGSIAESPVGWRDHLHIAPSGEAQRVLGRYIATTTAPAQPDLSMVRDPETMSLLVAGIVQEG